jgi:hypothetical protein
MCLAPLWLLLVRGDDDERESMQRYAAKMPAVSCSLVWQGDLNQSQYTLKFKNLSGKSIKAFEWKYLTVRAKGNADWLDAVFYEKDFILMPNESKEIAGFYAFPKSRNKFLRGLLNITKINFVDGTEWIRQEYKDTAYNRALLSQGLSKMEE